MSTTETLQALLKKNREHERISGPGVNNHVPMVLIALYRLGASSGQMNRYAEPYKLHQSVPPTADDGTSIITRENWRSFLGRGTFSNFLDLFESWTKSESIEPVLQDCVPVLMKGVCSAAYHALLRLGYALDYGSREEVAYALAYWASDFYPSPDFDPRIRPVEPELFLSEIVAGASNLRIQPVNSIDGRLRQVYDAREIAKLWKPIRIKDSDPLEEMSALIMALFANSQHFTILHALTSCQALRRVLPYIQDPEKSLSEYWHSVCAAYLTVSRTGFKLGNDTSPPADAGWPEIFAAAADSQDAMEHKVKLAYSCRLEFDHYSRGEYLRLASREIRTPSPFI